LQSWFKTTRALLFEQQGRKWPAPADLQPPTYVPPLTAAKQKQQMLQAWAVSLLILVPVATYFLVTLLTQ
jgi:hypothetical protein